jgi:hypothetical protein
MIRFLLSAVFVLQIAAAPVGAASVPLEVPLTASAISAAANPAPADQAVSPFEQSDLDEVVAAVEGVLPASWHVIQAGLEGAPVGWSGPADGMHVTIEDTRTRFFHPEGFHYYSFYRIWLMPPDWEGEMDTTSYSADSPPAFLLGRNEKYLALYHTSGGNAWDAGPSELCAALGLDEIRYTDLNRRIVDMDTEQRLISHEKTGESSSFEMNPYRIIGLAREGSGLYLEYVFPEDGLDEFSDVTQNLASSIFSRFPEVDSLYLRRCTADTFTDTIVSRD